MPGVGPQLGGGTGVADSRKSGRGGSGVPGGVSPLTFVWTQAAANVDGPVGNGVAVGEGWFNVLNTVCQTRNNSAAQVGVNSTTPYGTGPNRVLQQTFGTRSEIEYRTDWLDFTGGGDYKSHTLGSSDNVVAGSLIRLAPGWRVKQVAQAASATVTATATFAAPVSTGSYVVAAAAMLSARSVVTPPVGGVLRGDAANATQRTARITVYEIASMAGESARSVTIDNTTGGVALALYEISEDDPLTVLVQNAILATPGLLGYWPMQESWNGKFKKLSGSLAATILTGGGGWTAAQQSGPDGRSYQSHITAQEGVVIADADALTPSVGAAGLTVGALVYVDSLAAIQSFFGKGGTSSNAREWEVTINTDGSVMVAIMNSSGTVARSRTTAAGTITTGGWYLIISRFGTTTTSTPGEIRINGVGHTGTAAGAGTANGNLGSGMTIGNRIVTATSQAFVGKMGHSFVVAGAMSDAACQAIESAADTEGWY